MVFTPYYKVNAKGKMTRISKAAYERATGKKKSTKRKTTSKRKTTKEELLSVKLPLSVNLLRERLLSVNLPRRSANLKFV